MMKQSTPLRPKCQAPLSDQCKAVFLKRIKVPQGSAATKPPGIESAPAVAREAEEDWGANALDRGFSRNNL
jgi:hypothetical protein